MQIGNIEIHPPPYYDSGVIEQLKEDWSHKRKSIMLVDSRDGALPKVLHERINADHDFIIAPDREQSLLLAKVHHPDLLLINTDSLQADDLELMAALRSDAELSPTAILLISAQSTDKTRAECLQAGADDCLAYPYQPEELNARAPMPPYCRCARREAR